MATQRIANPPTVVRFHLGSPVRGYSSVVEQEVSNLRVAGSIPVTRSKIERRLNMIDEIMAANDKEYAAAARREALSMALPQRYTIGESDWWKLVKELEQYLVNGTTPMESSQK